MEKTKLNLSVPLLSVRRINSNIRQPEGVNRKNIENSQPNSRQQSLCVPKSDCELSVAVPFCWEQAPGKRRGENGGGGKVYPCEDTSTMPRLPPGRKPDSRRFYSCDRPCPQDSFMFQNEALALKDLDGLVESMHAKGEFDVGGRDCTYSAIETPQFAPKNDRLVTEQKPLAKKYEPYIVPYYSDYAEDVVTKENEANDKRSRKFWKLFPRLSVKSSLGGLLNPFPGTKSKSQGPTSSTNEVKRLARNAPSRPLNNARKAYSGPLEKQNYDAIYKQRFRSGALSGELCIADKRSGAISPYRNATPPSRFNEGTRFLGVPREVENLKNRMFSSFREVDGGYLWDTPIQSTCKGGSDSSSDVVEKTVYVDSVNYVKTTSLDLSSSSKPNGVMDSVENVEQTSAAKSCGCNIRTQSGLDLGKRLNHEELKNLNQEPNQKQGSRELSVVHHHRNTNTSSGENFIKPDYRSYSDVTSSLSPYPPLPKSPSESWLWRTLPSIPSRSHNDQINQSPRATNTATKREITVKFCNEHHSNSFYSEELVPYGSHIW